MKEYNKTYESLMDYANTMKIIDTHEHLHPTKTFIGEEPDVLKDYLSHYISSDLYAAGMSDQDMGKVCDYKTNINDRFKLLEPWLNQVKNTSYYRSLEISAKTIHDVNQITHDTIEELNEKFKKAASNKDYGKYIMKDLCNIEVSINDNWEDDMKFSTTELFAPVWQPVVYLNYTGKDDAPYSDPIHINIENITLNEYCEHFKKHLTKQISDGAKGLKFPVAYWRSLFFEDVDYEEAARIFDEVKKSKEHFPKKLQDYMMHFILGAASENNIPVQIHTGIQEGMKHNLEFTNPMLLKNLFDKFPDLIFDIFHTSYPFERELTVLAKYYTNVYVDFCWSHIISPIAAKNAFYEMLDVLPYTKIFGFGGDYLFFDGIVGHLTLAKQDICSVLAQKVANDECDYGLAEKILQAVLYDNPKRVFKL